MPESLIVALPAVYEVTPLISGKPPFNVPSIYVPSPEDIYTSSSNS